MTTTDLKPGDVVRQPAHGYGIVYVDGTGETLVMHCSAKGRISIADLDGWERVETCTADAVRILEDYQQIVSKSAGVVVRDAVVMMTTAAYEAYRGREIVQPGHVQVRVDDLDPQTLSEWSQYTVHSDCDSVLVRTGRAFIGQQVEYNPRCPKRGEKATSATVTLPCPDCGEGITHRVVVRLDPDVFSGGYYLAFEGEYPVTNHRCPPAQPDEPTGLGAVVEVGGKRFVRTDEDGHPWIDNVAYWHTWDEITARGPVTVLSEGLAS